MDKAKVVKVITEVLSELQSISGRNPVPISEELCPIGDLDEFDSLNGVEATVE